MENKYRPEIITLHKYFIWSNRMRTHFDEILQKQDGKEKKENFDIESIMYLSLWYATLNTVIEGWKTLKLEDPKIDALLQSENTNHLKMFRHGVLHYQKDYFDQRFQGMLESNDSVNWVRTLCADSAKLALFCFAPVTQKTGFVPEYPVVFPDGLFGHSRGPFFGLQVSS